jgi:hypothetical protein
MKSTKKKHDDERWVTAQLVLLGLMEADPAVSRRLGFVRIPNIFGAVETGQAQTAAGFGTVEKPKSSKWMPDNEMEARDYLDKFKANMDRGRKMAHIRKKHPDRIKAENLAKDAWITDPMLKPGTVAARIKKTLRIHRHVSSVTKWILPLRPSE